MANAFVKPGQELTTLQRIGRAVGGFGAGVGGRGADFLEGIRREEQELSIERQKAAAEDLRRARSLLDRGDLEGLASLATQRVEMIQQLGGDPKDTLGILNLTGAAMQGDRNALATLDSEINLGLRSAADAGLISMPETPQPLSPEGKRTLDVRRGFIEEEPSLKFEEVLDEGGKVVAQRNVETGQVVTSPLATARIEQEKERAEQKVAQKEQTVRVEGNIQNIDDTMSIINRLTTHKGFEKAVGLKVPFATSIPGTEAADFAAIVETAKARLGFDELARMRANSPTGGALGQVTERELAFLQAAVQSLDLAQSEEQFKENLQLIGESLGRFKAAQQQFLSPQGLPEGTVDNGDGTFTLPSGIVVERE